MGGLIKDNNILRIALCFTLSHCLLSLSLVLHADLFTWFLTLHQTPPQVLHGWRGQNMQSCVGHTICAHFSWHAAMMLFYMWLTCKIHYIWSRWRRLQVVRHKADIMSFIASKIYSYLYYLLFHLGPFYILSTNKWQHFDVSVYEVVKKTMVTHWPDAKLQCYLD